jgi:hypothetical protein
MNAARTFAQAMIKAYQRGLSQSLATVMSSALTAIPDDESHSLAAVLAEAALVAVQKNNTAAVAVTLASAAAQDAVSLNMVGSVIVQVRAAMLLPFACWHRALVARTDRIPGPAQALNTSKAATDAIVQVIATAYSLVRTVWQLFHHGPVGTVTDTN